MNQFIKFIILPVIVISMIPFYILDGNLIMGIQFVILGASGYLFAKQYSSKISQFINMGLASAIVLLCFFISQISFRYIAGKISLSQVSFETFHVLFIEFLTNILVGITSFLLGGMVGKYISRKSITDNGSDKIKNFFGSLFWIVVSLVLFFTLGVLGAWYGDVRPGNICVKRAYNINAGVEGNLDKTFDFLYNSCFKQETRIFPKSYLSENSKEKLKTSYTDLKSSLSDVDVSYDEWKQETMGIPVSNIDWVTSLNSQYKEIIEGKKNAVFDKINLANLNLDNDDKKEFNDGILDLQRAYNLKVTEIENLTDNVRKINLGEISEAEANNSIKIIQADANSYLIIGICEIIDVLQKNGIKADGIKIQEI